MTATPAPSLWPTVAARTPPERKAALEELAAGDGRKTSELINAALELYLEHRRTGKRLLDAPREGTTRRHDRATSKRAAEYAAPRTGTGRRRALVIIASRPDGATTDEVLEALERRAAGRGERAPVQNSVARRVTDLLEAGAIEEARGPLRVVAPHLAELEGNDPDEELTVTRKTRSGADATVWTATRKGLEWVDAVTEPEA